MNQFDKINQLIAKLNMTGQNVLEYNNAGIVVRKDSSSIVLYIPNDDKIDRIEYEDCIIKMSKYFIAVYSEAEERLIAVYTAGTKNILDSLNTSKYINMYTTMNVSSINQGFFKTEKTKIALITDFSDNQAGYLVSYNGKVLDIKNIIHDLEYPRVSYNHYGEGRHIICSGLSTNKLNFGVTDDLEVFNINEEI